MNLKVKKIIAREFIFLISIITGVILLYFATFLYNFFYLAQIKSIEHQIVEKRQLSDSLANRYRIKDNTQTWLHSEFINSFNVIDNPNYTRTEMWKGLYRLAKADSIELKWNTTWKDNVREFFLSIDMNSPGKVERFIERNYIYPQDISNYKRSQNINMEITVLNDKQNKFYRNILSRSQQYSFAVSASLVLFIFAFLVRYTLYGIRWALIVLKTSD